MKLVLLTIFFASQSAFCAHNNKSQIVVVEKLRSKHDGPPLYIRDVYTNGKRDPYFPNLLVNIRKSYPLLTDTEIVDCIEYCGRCSNADYDIIAECQEFELWKAEHLSEIKDKQTCFEEYMRRRD